MTVKVPTVIHIGGSSGGESNDDIDDDANDDESSHSSTLSSLSDFVSLPRPFHSQQRYSGFSVVAWDKKTLVSNMILEGLDYLQQDTANVVALYESPSSASRTARFFNHQVYRICDYPPDTPLARTVLGPCRYALVHGTAFPMYLQHGRPPAGLLEHWRDVLPSVFVEPKFVSEIDVNARVYAYAPCESIPTHINDPFMHFHLSGLDSLHLLTKRTPRLLATVERPCIVKVTHALSNDKGTFVIKSTLDEEKFAQYLVDSGQSSYIVTEYFQAELAVSGHFFIHPNGSVIWLGSNEICQGETSILTLSSQDYLRDLQLLFCRDVVHYCRSLGYWGNVGMDVLFKKNTQGYLTHVYPRVTATLPAVMMLQWLGMEYCLYKHGKDSVRYEGTASELLEQVSRHNAKAKNSKVVLFSFVELKSGFTKMTIGVYGKSLDLCQRILDRFCWSAIASTEEEETAVSS
ncbi:hypothetical protein MPSEU_000075900 [Mayamaea pseudoterrestris]|nr:hypothetical protein MPSEU_000075900 [Mayamaea pseudoterrestris]